MVLAPVLGAWADRTGLRALLLRISTGLTVLGTVALAFCEQGGVLTAAVAFIFTNAAFLISVVFYDATLSEVSSAENAPNVSSIAWSIGYAGGLIGLFLSLMTIGTDDNRVQEIFCISAALFVLLALPLLVATGRKQGIANVADSPHRALTGRAVVAQFWKNRRWRRLLLSYFLYSNGVSTIIYFTSVFATKTLGYGLDGLVWLFIAMSLVAIPSSVAFGWLASRYGQVKIIKMVILGWIGTIVAVSLAGAATFAVVSCVASSLLGPIQALSRSLFRVVFPQHMMSSCFGVQAIAARSSALIGPLMFGLISFVSGSQRVAVLATGVLFLGGLALLRAEPTD
jgi:UMF1 family MFS transporter